MPFTVFCAVGSESNTLCLFSWKIQQIKGTQLCMKHHQLEIQKAPNLDYMVDVVGQSSQD